VPGSVTARGQRAEPGPGLAGEEWLAGIDARSYGMDSGVDGGVHELLLLPPANAYQAVGGGDLAVSSYASSHGHSRVFRPLPRTRSDEDNGAVALLTGQSGAAGLMSIATTTAEEVLR
jgi:hypothetical protein